MHPDPSSGIFELLGVSLASQLPHTAIAAPPQLVPYAALAAPRAAEAVPSATRSPARASSMVPATSRLRPCQVAGCASPPSEPRSYSGRCRLCVTHMRADTVQLGDELLRFCQKCNRLQPLVDFEGAKHTCRTQLTTHNERRRSTRAPPQASAAAENSPAQRQARRVAVASALRARWDGRGPGARTGAVAGPALLLPTREASPQQAASPLQVALEHGLFDLGDWLADELGGDDSGGDSGCSTSPGALPGAATAAFAAAWPQAHRPVADTGVSTPPPASQQAAYAHAQAKSGEGTNEGSGDGFSRDTTQPPDAYALFMAGAAAATAAVAAELRSRTVHVKLPHEGVAAQEHPHVMANVSTHGSTHAVAPAQLQPLPVTLAHMFTDPTNSAAAASFLESLAVAVRPGCVLLTLDVTMPAQSGDDGGDALAEELLRRALASPGAAGSLLRGQRSFTIADGAGGEATYGGSAQARVALERDVAMAPRAPPLGPLALLVLSDKGSSENNDQGEVDAISLRFATPVPEGTAVHCRTACGKVLVATSRDGGAALAVRGAGGLAAATLLVEVLPPGAQLHRAGAPRPVLLTTDAAIAAEVAAAGDALRQLDAGAACAAAAASSRDAVEGCVRALGAALSPDASPRIITAAATACLWMGWPAALTALLRRSALADGSAAATERLLSLLAHAAAAARPDMMIALCNGAPPLAAGGKLAADLVEAAKKDGHARGQFALAVAREALAARTGAAAGATTAAAMAAETLLASAAAAIDAKEARRVAKANAAAADDNDDISAAAAAAAVAHAAEADASEAKARARAMAEVSQAQLGPATAAECEAFDAECAAVGAPTARIYLLFVLSLDVFGYVRRMALRRSGPPITPGELTTLTRVLTTEETMRAYFYYHSWTFFPNTLALLLLLLAPAASRARRFYIKNARALFSAHCFITFIATHVYFELYLRRWLAVPAAAGLLPRWWSVGQLNITASAATAPMPAGPLCALLALRALLMFAPEAWSIWPQGRPLWGELSQARANAVLTILLCAGLLRHERRHFSSWRHARAALRAAKEA